MSSEDDKMKLFYMQLITTKTDGLAITTIHSEVRGESMEQCFEYTKKLHNGENNTEKSGKDINTIKTK